MSTTNVVSLANRQSKPASHPADDLSFMEKRKPLGTGINYWAVEATGEYSKDSETGAILAGEFLEYVGANPTFGNSHLLSSIVEGMFQRLTASKERCLTGIEIAFLRHLSEAVVLAATSYQSHFKEMRRRQLLAKDAFDNRPEKTYYVTAYTDCIGGTVLDRQYRSERILIDPKGNLCQPCLVVCQFRGGGAFLSSWQPTRRDDTGRFSRKKTIGVLTEHGIHVDLEDGNQWIRVLGRVLDDRRPPIVECPSKVADLR